MPPVILPEDGHSGGGSGATVSQDLGYKYPYKLNIIRINMEVKYG